MTKAAEEARNLPPPSGYGSNYDSSQGLLGLVPASLLSEQLARPESETGGPSIAD